MCLMVFIRWSVCVGGNKSSRGILWISLLHPLNDSSPHFVVFCMSLLITLSFQSISSFYLMHIIILHKILFDEKPQLRTKSSKQTKKLNKMIAKNYRELLNKVGNENKSCDTHLSENYYTSWWLERILPNWGHGREPTFRIKNNRRTFLIIKCLDIYFKIYVLFIS